MALLPELALLLRLELAVTRVLFNVPVISTRFPEYSFGLVSPVS